MPQTNRLARYFKEGQDLLIAFCCGSCGKAFPGFTLGTYSSGCSLSRVLPCGNPKKWYAHETIIFKLGKMIQPWLKGKITPKSLCFCSLSYILFFYPYVFPQVEGGSTARSPLLVQSCMWAVAGAEEALVEGLKWKSWSCHQRASYWMAGMQQPTSAEVCPCHSSISCFCCSNLGWE